MRGNLSRSSLSQGTSAARALPRVLVIEDDAEMAAAICSCLTGRGVRTGALL
jgi:hypothetical protein